MIEKKLVFDVVFISDNEKVFELRLKKLSKKVDYFLIFGIEESLSKIKKFYDSTDNKIITFVIEGDLFDYEFISNSVLSTVQNLYKSFDDLILFSYSNEVPDLDSIDEIITKSKDVNVMVCDVYENDFNMKRKYPETGPVLMNFSHMLRNKKIFISRFFDLNLKKLNDLAIYNGFKIINYIPNNSIIPTTYTCPYSGKILEYENKVSNRKFVFFFDTERQTVDAEFVFEIKFVENFPEKIEVDFNKPIQEMEIFLPKTLLYFEDYDEFILEYKTNEIKRILSVFNCQDEDEIEIWFQNNKIRKLKYDEIKNPSF